MEWDNVNPKGTGLEEIKKKFEDPSVGKDKFQKAFSRKNVFQEAFPRKK